jgi:hypothetical protein
MPAQDVGQSWALRAARNQSLFRAINEELRHVRSAGRTLTIACECADVDCVETLAVDVDRYAEIRREPTHFIVLRGHVYPEVERIVEDDGAITIVEKTGEAARVAAASDGKSAGG